MWRIILLSLAFCCFSCAGIPKEAPQLSSELGKQLRELEEAHLHLVHLYFENKRHEVLQFLEKEWSPLFVKNFFDQEAIADTWVEIVEDDDRENRIEFILLITPEIQEQINKKYNELNEPLDQLERELTLAVQKKYQYSREANQSLTGLLKAKSSAMRFRVADLYALDFVQKPVDKLFGHVDRLTAEALKGTDKIDEMEGRLDQFKGELNKLLTVNF